MYLAEHLTRDHGIAESWMNGKSFGALAIVHREASDIGSWKREHTHDPKEFNDPVYEKRKA
jgi:hypothetical protein